MAKVMHHFAQLRGRDRVRLSAVKGDRPWQLHPAAKQEMTLERVLMHKWEAEELRRLVKKNFRWLVARCGSTIWDELCAIAGIILNGRLSEVMSERPAPPYAWHCGRDKFQWQTFY